MSVVFSIKASTAEEFRQELLADLKRRRDQKEKFPSRPGVGQRNYKSGQLILLDALIDFYTQLVIEPSGDKKDEDKPDLVETARKAQANLLASVLSSYLHDHREPTVEQRFASGLLRGLRTQ